MVKYFLYGPSGSGKTTIGRLLAAQLALEFVDLDEKITASEQKTIPEIFAESGETGFRLAERRALAHLLAAERELVAALGGGALLDPENRALTEAAGPVLCLGADPDVLKSRLEAAPDERPLLAGGADRRLRTYLEDRAAHYASFANRLDTSQLNPAAAAEQAGRSFGAFRITGMGPAYDARIRRGALAELPAMLETRELRGPFLLVADSNTERYAARIGADLRTAGFDSRTFTFPAGETQKTAETAAQIWAALTNADLERGSTLIAVGGGVVGDLGGFAAATYLRGIAWVCAPTSLLAMVDAALGGKTGVDLPQGKNLVGAFHAPRLVLADPDVLETLPDRDFANGMAEVIKSAVIGDAELFNRCAAGAPRELIDEVIARAAAVKVRAIVADPYEQGIRAHLNFGHTYGHAIEHVSNYRISHGEAVAIGMAAEAALAERMGLAASGLADEIRGCLAANALPAALPDDLDPEEILKVMQKDKKKTAGRIRFALPIRIGDMMVRTVEEALYRTVLISGSV